MVRSLHDCNLALNRLPIHPAARSFIRQLLEIRPSSRMTLSDARSHPWLRSYKPVYTEAQRRAMTRSLSPETASVNASMVSAMDDDSFLSPIEGGDAGVSQSLEHMNLSLKNAQDDAMGDDPPTR